jgi:hypothetical protein
MRGPAGTLLAAAAVASMVTVPAWSGDAAATGSRSLVAGASAQGMRVTYTIPDQFAVSQIMDGGGPVAQASVDTTGKAIGFASLPYPGENGVTAPGLLTFATGQPIPPYPFYAEANHPTKEADEVSDPSGAYSLKASAAAGKAAGTALTTFGDAQAPMSRSSADASGVTTDEETRLEAVSVNESLSFGGGVLRIGSVTSRSLSTYGAGDDRPETKNELLIEGARVGDQPVTIGPDGIHAGDQTVPGPVDGGASAELLKQAGITVRTVSSEPVEGGGALQILEVTVRHAIPGATVQGTFVYQIGGASSFIILGDQEPGIDLEETTTVEPPPAPASSSAAEPQDAAPAPAAPVVAPPVLAGGVTPQALAPAALPAPVTTPAVAPVPPLPAPFDAPTPTAPDIPADTPAESAAPPVMAQPVVSVRDLRDQMKPLIGVAGLGGGALLAACAAWCLRRSPAGS